jgi:hypothetical protein
MRLNPPTRPHPFAATAYFLADGIRKLRTVHAEAGNVLQQRIFWRGVADRGLDQRFFEQGGTEFACSSTSLERHTAHRFAFSDCPLHLKFVVQPLAHGCRCCVLIRIPSRARGSVPAVDVPEAAYVWREQYAGTAVLVVEVEPAIGAN